MRQTPRADRGAKPGLHLCPRQISRLACYDLSVEWECDLAPQKHAPSHIHTQGYTCAAITNTRRATFLLQSEYNQH